MTPTLKGEAITPAWSWKPSLHLAAVRALEAKVNHSPNADTAVAAFREQLFIETGLSEALIGLLKGEHIL